MYSHSHGVEKASVAVPCGFPSRWCAMWLFHQFVAKPNEKMPPW